MAAGFKIKQFDRGLHGLGDGREKHKADAAVLGQRNNFQFRGNNGGERAFAAGEEMAEVVRLAEKPIQTVAGPAFKKTRRKLLRNQRGVFADQFASALPLRPKRVTARAGLLDAPVGQDDFQREHVIGRHAIKRNMRAGGIVGDHAAERGA